MQLDRWALPPAIAAAVFTTIAIVPPGGPVARGVRVELLGDVAEGRPLLVRLAIEDAGTERWHAPRVATVRIAGVAGAEAAPEVSSVPGVPYGFARVVPRGPGPYVLEVAAEGLAARVPLSSRAGPPLRWGSAPSGAHGIDVVVEGGALVPEVPGTVLVRVQDARGEVAIESTDPSLRFSPARATLDACGVAAFEAVVAGLDAHVVVRLAGDAARVARRRLPLTPGGLVVRAEEGAVQVAAPVGGSAVFALAGDARGVIHWGASRLDNPPDANAHARLHLPPDAAWALVSRSPAFEGPVGLWLGDPPAGGCVRTPLGLRFARASAPLPEPPAVRVAHDGAALALEAREARRHRARVVALTLAMAAITMLVGLVLTAGLRGDPAALREVSASPRQRMAIALGGAGALLVGGLVLVVTFLLRT